jgi:hypothetical protein
VTERARDRLLAVVTAAFAITYLVAAGSIEDSMLADTVGAGGVPRAVGIAMLIAAVALFARTLVRRDAATQADASDSLTGAVFRTLALVAILVLYGVLLPILGYPLTVSLLVLAVGWLAGAALKWPLFLCAAFSGPILWAVFDRLLQVRMLVGSLWA